MIWFLEDKWDQGKQYLPDDYHKRPIKSNVLQTYVNIYMFHHLGNSLNESDFKIIVEIAIKDRES